MVVPDCPVTVDWLYEWLSLTVLLQLTVDWLLEQVWMYVRCPAQVWPAARWVGGGAVTPGPGVNFSIQGLAAHIYAPVQHVHGLSVMCQGTYATCCQAMLSVGTNLPAVPFQPKSSGTFLSIALTFNGFYA